VKSLGKTAVSADARLRDSANSFQLLVTRVLDYAIFMLAPDGRVVSWNAGAQRLKGYREDEIVGQHFSHFYPPEDIEAGRPQRGLELALAQGCFQDEGWRVRKDGSAFWANTVIVAIRDKTGELLGFAKIVRDLTERRLAAEEIKASEARLQAFMNHSPSLMFIKDLEGRYVHVNDRFAQAFGLAREDIISRTDFELFPPEFAAQFRANDAKVLGGGAALEVEEVALYRDGRWHTSIVHKFPVLDGHGRITALGGVVTDITERKRLEEALNQKNIQLSAAIAAEIALREDQQRLTLIANHDALTGVASRTLLQQRVEHAIAVSRRSSRLFALLFIDLDQFKDVNDSFGHDAGDQVLREVAMRLAGCLREVDTIARQGGDEFVVLLEDVETPEEVEQIAARMQEVLAEPLAIAGGEIQVTSSIGVALYPRHGETVSALLGKADLAMYRAKELGRNTVVFYTPGPDAPSTVRGPLDG
jgi:diguanylate cyclase (GGDEF)-like protein/PAS domain S-box-containing protein